MELDAQTQRGLVLSENRRLTYDDWPNLNHGDRVVVHRPGYGLQLGTVDDVAEDAGYFWVRIDGQNRIFVDNCDDLVLYSQLP